MKTKKIKRREFLRKGGAAIIGAGAVAKFSTIPHKVLGANEKIVAGAIGTGRQGGTNMRDFILNDEIEMAAVSDVYEPHMERAIEITKGKAVGYKDFRRIIDRKDIDVVIISTPDHWHALPTIYACESGKDVYVEKPISHNVYEGRKMVEFARRYKRIVQVGTQQRSGTHFQRAVKFVQSGKLGPISMVKCWNFGNSYPDGVGNTPDSHPPPDLDWDMWLGPAPEVPYNSNRWIAPPGRGWPSFRWFWDYAGGMLTDWGTHLFDIVLWAMEVNSPLAVGACGGKNYIRDNRETPDTIEVNYEFPGFIMTYTNTILNSKGFDNHGYGIQFYGTNGTLFVDRNGFNVEPEVMRVNKERVEKMEPITSKGSEQHKTHVRDFIDCVKSRELPISDIENGHYSTNASHLGNIAFRTKREIKWDAKNEKITNSVEANNYLKREYRTPWKLPD